MSSTDALSRSISLCPGESFSVALRTLGFQRIVTIDDNLMVGPCGTSYDEHLRKRKRFWKDFMTHFPEVTDRSDIHAWPIHRRLISKSRFGRLLGSASSDTRIILWTTPSLKDRVVYWWLLNAMSSYGTRVKRCWVVEPKVLDKRNNVFLPLGSLDLMEIAEAFPSSMPLTKSEMKLGKALWRAFSSCMARDLFSALRKSAEKGAEYRAMAEDYLKFFPALHDGRFLLSQVDQVIFDHLAARSWKRPIDLLSSKFVKMLFLLTGDEFLPLRLHCWAAATPSDPVLLSRAEPDGRGIFHSASFALTARGVEIKRNGLNRLDEIPRVHLAGCVGNKNKGWVRITQGGQSRIESV